MDMRSVRIWDLPTRIFHWLLVVCVAGMVITAKADDLLHWHVRLGVVTLSLVVFRLIWGRVGGHWSRFAHFVPSASTLAAYIRGTHTPAAGHNPLGALSVLGILLLLLLQVVCGLMIQNDDAGFTGPLYAWVPNAVSDAAQRYHDGVGQPLLYAWGLLHVGAIAWHLRKRDRFIVRAMFSGDQVADATVTPSHDSGASRLLALAIWLALLVAVWQLV